MTVKVILAKPHGICGNPEGFGVARAIHLACKTAKAHRGKTYLLGEIVHNQHVVDSLEEDFGVKTVKTIEEIPQGAAVVVRAHGIVPAVYEAAKARGLNIVDATCPLVQQVHKEVKKLAAEGKHILYIASDYKHDEALGVVGEVPDRVTLITLQDLGKQEILHPKNTVVLTQTTLSTLETKEELDKLKKKHPGLTIKSHICLATTGRQKAVIELAKRTGIIVIVGSPTSSNAKRLKEAAEASGAKAYLVDTASDLDASWFKGINTVGVSSGASTPEDILNEVVEKIKSF